MPDFADPWVLLLLLVPLVVRLLPGKSDVDGPSVLVPDGIGAMLGSGGSAKSGLSISGWVMPVLLWASLVTALAGPRLLLTNPALPVTGRDLVLSLDLSGSMVRKDFQLDGREVARLDALKHVARNFVLGRGGDRVALVIFASRAYFATPQTHDVQAVAKAIDEATIGVSGRATGISEGLGLSLKRLQDSEAASKVIILLSDGINNSGPVKPRDAALLAQQQGVRVHTIAMGPRDLQNADGERDAVDTETLRAIADLSGGQYFRAKTTDHLQAVAEAIDKLEAIPSDGPGSSDLPTAVDVARRTGSFSVFGLDAWATPMIEMFGLLWLRPAWLALIPVGLTLGVLIVRRARDLGAWTRAMDLELLMAMQRMGRITGGAPRRAWLPALILIVLGIALAGPGIERRDVAGFRNLDAVVIVMDLSPSVTEGEQLFDLLTAARIVVERAGTRQVGLIVYAGEAYVAAPLTTDARALTGTLSLIDAETMPLQGSNPSAGLVLAEEMLTEAEILAADVVLLTDGAGIGVEAVASAQRLAARNAPVSVIHLSQTPELVALARTGVGKTATIADPFPVANHIASRLADRLGETDYSMLAIRDLGRLLLILALLLAAFLLPRRGTA